MELNYNVLEASRLKQQEEKPTKLSKKLTAHHTLDKGSSALIAMQRWINTKLAPTPTPPSTGGNTGNSGGSGASLVVDGYWGVDTTRALQRKYGTPQDGIISSQDAYWKSKNPGLTSGWEWVNNASGSQLIVRLQKEWGIPNGDGIIGSGTIRAMQKHYGVPQTGTLTENAPAIRKMQEQLRQGTKPSTGTTGGGSSPVTNRLGYVSGTKVDTSTQYDQMDLISLLWHLEKRVKVLRATPGFARKPVPKDAEWPMGTAEVIINYLAQRYLKGNIKWTLSAELFHERNASILEKDTIAKQILAVLRPFFNPPEKTELLYFKDSIGGQIDLPHLAVTILGYQNVNPLAPDRWTGWAGDAATATSALARLYARNKDKVNLLAAAEAFVGLSDEQQQKHPALRGLDLTDVGNPFSLADLCSDSDAIFLASAIDFSSKAEHALTDVLVRYYTDSAQLKQRYRHILGAARTSSTTANAALLAAGMTEPKTHFILLADNPLDIQYAPHIATALAKKIG